jgi:hypothetical protein
MKFAWRKNIADLTAWNSGQIEEVDQIDGLDEYCEMLDVDESAAEFDRLEHGSEFVLID